MFYICSNSAWANFPASVMPTTYCYSTSNTAYACSGPKFEDARGAAKYACQQISNNNSATASDIASLPLNSPSGLTPWGTFSFTFSCAAGTTFSTGWNNRVQALPDCKGSVPINNFTPASCAGEPPAPPPVACVNTRGLTITAFHQTPVLLQACYAGCNYSAVNVAVTTYNGVDYSAGSWVGIGDLCPVDGQSLIGGIPGNAQNVGGGGGLSANDLLGLAREETLQQLLANAQQSATFQNQNSQLLQSIRDSTAAIASKDDSLDMSDPEGFEAVYREKVAATPTTHGGAVDTLPSETVNLTNTFTNPNGFINASCPSLPSFAVMGRSYSFDLSLLCQLAVSISYLVVTLAAITGVKIFIGGVK